MSVTDKFRDFTAQNYQNQAVAFLNAYWLEVNQDSEAIWNYCHKFAELDVDNKAEGKDLDEFNAHRFLESVGEVLRVVELRDKLKEIDLDFNKRMSLIEYLIFRYKKSVSDFISRPQGDNSAEIEKATKMLEEVQVLLDEAIKKADAAKESADLARNSASEAAAAEAEQKSALEALQNEEKARDEKTQQLTQKSEDENLGVVARNRSKNELAQHLAEDPLPLRRAKITSEAATKKAQKAREAADAAKASAEADEAVAENSKVEAEKSFKEAQDYLDEVKAKSGGNGQGSIWWLQRELEEKKKYMPKRKGGNW